MGKPKNDDDVVICNPPRGESDPEAVGLLRLQLAVAPEQRKTTEIERWMRQERALQRGSCRDVASQPDNRVFSNNTIAELSGGHIHALRAGDVAGAESWSASQMYPVVIRRRIAKFCRRPANERTSVVVAAAVAAAAAASACLIARRQPRYAAAGVPSFRHSQSFCHRRRAHGAVLHASHYAYCSRAPAIAAYLQRVRAIQ